jgi:hypothetical protein
MTCVSSQPSLLNQDINYIIDPRSSTTIALDFKGDWPLNAQYLLIISDWISGVGPTVFRKDL